VPRFLDWIDEGPGVFNFIARANNVASPAMASSCKRSYASGEALPKLVP
jgi:hypothetical protein